MSAPRVLIAGIGNVFFGDDGFGVEVVRCLLGRAWPGNVFVRDFGIRGRDLAYTLLDGYEVAIFVDATQRGGAPGTLYVVEPDSCGAEDVRHLDVDGHAMDPARVLAFVRAMGRAPTTVRVVGCEPARFADEDEPTMGLSEAVQAAVEPAAGIVADLVRQLSTFSLEAPRA